MMTPVWESRGPPQETPKTGSEPGFIASMRLQISSMVASTPFVGKGSPPEMEPSGCSLHMAHFVPPMSIPIMSIG